MEVLLVRHIQMKALRKGNQSLLRLSVFLLQWKGVFGLEQGCTRDCCAAAQAACSLCTALQAARPFLRAAGQRCRGRQVNTKANAIAGVYSSLRSVLKYGKIHMVPIFVIWEHSLPAAQRRSAPGEELHHPFLQKYTIWKSRAILVQHMLHGVMLRMLRSNNMPKDRFGRTPGSSMLLSMNIMGCEEV